MTPLLILLLAFAAILISGTAYAKKNALELFAKSSRRALKRAHLQRKTAGDVVYWSGGSGTRTLVLIHGVNDQAGTWAAVVPALAKKYRLVIPDLAGHGESGPKEGPLPIGLILDGLRAVLDAEASGERVTLVGNSMGGWMSMLFAAEHPERVEALILEDASGMMWDLSKGPPLFPKTREEVAIMMKAVNGPDVPVPPDSVLDELLKRGPTSPMSRVMQGGVFPYLIDSKLPKLTMPVTLIWGGADGLLPLDFAEALKTRIAGARLEVIERAGHIPHRQQPAKFVALVDGALAN
jgi:pimeloyl-ACP methyl ester carboxylesterase